MDNLFVYNKKNDDDSDRIVREKENFFEMERSNPIIYPDSLNDLSDEILNDKKIMDNYKFDKKKEKRKYVLKSKKIWKELNIKLEKVTFLKSEYDSKKFNGVLDKEFMNSLLIDYPYYIPISFTDNYLETQASTFQLTLKSGKCVVFKNILLPKFDKKVDSFIYAHEITHTQIENKSGSSKFITNSETLPIVVEQLFADKLDVLELNRNNRLQCLAIALKELVTNKDMDFCTKITYDTYITSILQAIDLFNKYLSGSNYIKKEFINHINLIFNGEKNIEDMIDNFNSNYGEIDYKLSKLLKK